MADQCVALVRGRAIRATELDACANVVMTAAPVRPSHGVSEGFVSVAIANEVDESDEINQKNANGDICVLVPPKQVIKWTNVTIVFCKVDPWIFSKMTRMPLVLNEAGDAIGFRGQRTIPQDVGTALEVWTGTKEDVQCSSVTALPKYGYLLLPYITSAMVSDFTVENAAINFTIVGKGFPNVNWGDGPYMVQIDDDPPVLMELADVMASEDMWHLQVTNLPPPAAVCGQYPATYTLAIADAVPPLQVSLTYTAGPVPAPSVVDWGDGTTSAGPIALATPVTHTYAAAGTYLVTSTVTATGATSYGVAIASV